MINYQSCNLDNSAKNFNRIHLRIHVELILCLFVCSFIGNIWIFWKFYKSGIYNIPFINKLIVSHIKREKRGLRLKFSIVWEERQCSTEISQQVSMACQDTLPVHYSGHQRIPLDTASCPELLPRFVGSRQKLIINACKWHPMKASECY